jgi:hypothetical protein
MVDDREAYERSGRKREGQRLSSMSSVRFDPEVIEAVKERALGEGITVGAWIRRLVAQEITEPRFFDLPVDGEGEPVRLPAEALERVVAALMPLIARYGSLEIRLGPPAWRRDGGVLTSTLPIAVQRPAGVIDGSGVAGEPRAIPSTLSRLRTFSCPHFSIGNVASAACEICGPLEAAA